MPPLIVPVLVVLVLFSLCSWRFGLGNAVWFLSGGWAALWYYFVGILCCVTIVGIPAGRQLFKLGRVLSMPFGLDVSPNPFCSPFITIANVVWAVCFGWRLFLGHVLAGVICALTIVGIPFAKQHLKIMKGCGGCSLSLEISTIEHAYVHAPLLLSCEDGEEVDASELLLRLLSRCTWR